MEVASTGPSKQVGDLEGCEFFDRLGLQVEHEKPLQSSPVGVRVGNHVAIRSIRTRLAVG